MLVSRNCLRGVLFSASLLAVACSGGDDNDATQPINGGVPLYPSFVSPPAVGATPSPGTGTAPLPGAGPTTQPPTTQPPAQPPTTQPPTTQPEPVTAPPVAVVETSFAADVAPLFEVKCAGCHTNERLTITNYAQASEIGDIILAAVQGPFTTSYNENQGIMPFFCGSGIGQGVCLTEEEFEVVRSWVEGNLLP